MATGNIIGEDGVARPPWATSNQLNQDYFDNEWGRPVITESGLLERVCLEGFQAGLSWSTVLRKRRGFRDHYFLFDANRVLLMTDQQRLDAQQDPELIRNVRKHQAIITNAQATVELRDGPDLQELPDGHPAHAVLGRAAKRLPAGLPVLIWSFTPENHEPPQSIDQIATVSKESQAMSAELKSRGFKFVGPTTCYAMMQAIGMVDDRVPEKE